MIWLLLYALLIASLFGLAATLAELICAELKWPRRSVWALALAGSLMIVVFAVVMPAEASGSGIVPFPFDLGLMPGLLMTVTATAGDPASGSLFSWPEWQISDAFVFGFLAVTSASMLLFCVVAAINLHLIVRGAEATTITGKRVMLSDRLGPAVVGVVRPRIVLPRWLAQQESAIRSLVLQHESEHLAARDQLLLFGALLVVVAMPWNPAVWWQLKRLRAAIEVDCDARVLRNGANARDYSEALLNVRQRSPGAPLGAVALTEPVSELERRIKIMMATARRFSLSRVGVKATLALSLIGLALAVNAPRAQRLDLAQSGGPVDPQTVPSIRTHVYDLLNQASQCMDNGDLACADSMLSAVWAQSDLNAYEEAQYWNFRAFLAFERNDLQSVAESFENVVESAGPIPEGLLEASLQYLASAYEQLGRHEEAYRTLAEYLERTEGELSEPRLGFGISDGEYLPIVKVAPIYPPRAVAQGIQGYVVVQYTVETNGATRDVVVVESSSPLLDRAAVESARKYKYKPRIVDGVPVEVAGVRTRIQFVLEPGELPHLDISESEPETNG